MTCSMSIAAKIKNLWSWWEHFRTRRLHQRSPRQIRRRRITAFILLLLIAAGYSLFWYYTNDNQFRPLVINTLQRFTGGEVEIEYASLGILSKIRIKGLRVYLPDRPHIADNLIFTARDIILEHDFWSFLQNKLIVKKIVAESAQLSIWYDIDRHITNLQLLHLVPASSAAAIRPLVILRGSTIEYRELAQGRITPPLCQNITGRIFPDPRELNIYHYDLRSGDQGLLTGSSFNGSYNFHTRQLTTNANFLLEAINPQTLPPRLAQWRRLYESLSPRGRIIVQSTYDPATGHVLRINAQNASAIIPLDKINLPLHDVRAHLVCSREGIFIEEFDSGFESYCRFVLTGKIDAYSKNSDFDLTLRTRDLDVPAGQWENYDPNRSDNLLTALINSLPAAVGKTIDTYSPTGRLDLELRMIRRRDLDRQKQGLPGNIEYQGTLFCRGAAGVYGKYPYILQNIHGPILFTSDHADIGPLSAREADRLINIEGLWDRHQPGRDHYDIHIRAENMPLDQNLYNAMSSWYRKLWDRFAPTGSLNALYHIETSGADRLKENLDIDLINVDICHEDLPLPIHISQGKLLWDPNLLTFDIEKAQAARGQISFAGTVAGLSQHAPIYDCKFDFTDMLLDDYMASKLTPKARDFCLQARLVSTISGQGRFWNNTTPTRTNLPPADQSGPAPHSRMPNFNYHITLALHDGKINYQDFPYPLENIQAHCRLNNDQLLISSLQGRHDNSRIQLTGFFRSDNDYHLNLRGQPLVLDEPLRKLFTDRKIRIWELIDPAGRVNVSLLLEHSPQKPQYNYHAEITPLNIQLRLADLDYTWQNVTGRITVDPNKINIDRLTSIDGPSSVSMTGSFDTTSGQNQYRLNLQGSSVPLSDKLLRALPAPTDTIAGRIQPSGLLDFDLQLDHYEQDQRDKIWDCVGSVALQNGCMQTPLLTESIHTQIKGSARFNRTAGELTLSADLLPTQMLIKQRPLNNLTGKVSYQSSDKNLILSEISGALCGGRLAGKAELLFSSRRTGYNLDLQFLDINLADILNASKRKKYQNLRGRFNGWYSLNQPAADDPRRGNFVFVIKDAVLGELPIAAKLLHVLNLSLPKEGAFNEATITADIIGDKTRYDPIHLKGSAVSLTGAGLMTGPDENLELVFMVDPPQYLPELPILSSFLDAIRPQIVQVRVSGSFDDPRVEPTAFPALSDALKKLEEDLAEPSKNQKPPRNQQN